MPRTIDCSYRSHVEQTNGTETARCMILQEITEVEDHELCRVRRDACEACLRKPTPNPSQINSVLVSLLYSLTEDIIRQNGVPGCTHQEALEFHEWALANIPYQPTQREEEQRHQHYQGVCRDLGEQTGTQACTTCHGSVQRKVFACHHPQHAETTIRDCMDCLDYEPRLQTGAVCDWAVGMTTAPRSDSTLKRSVDSLATAGWRELTIFAEPGCQELPDGAHVAHVIRDTRIGAWPNWLLGLSELVLRNPTADAYLMCQDDVVFCQGLRAYLESELWPADRIGVVSLYSPSPEPEDGGPGFHIESDGWNTWGAAAYVFSNASARALLCDRRVMNHRQRGPADGMRNVDCVVGRWCRESGLPYYVHLPSLAEHIGETSTLFPQAEAKGKRHAQTFVGEDVDARSIGTATAEPSVDGAQTNTDAPQVVVSIPTYENGDTLRRAVESILQQTHHNLLVVVTNDGHSDAWEPIADITDPRLVRFDLPHNRGRYFADAVVLEATDAPYFLIQDADDWSEPHRVTELLAEIERSDAVGAVSATYFHTPDNGPPQIRIHDAFQRKLNSEYAHRIDHHGLFRTDALRNLGGYFGGFRIGYDTFLCNLLLMTGQVAYSERPLYHYVVRDDSLSHAADTGMRSRDRKEVRAQLQDMYNQAWHCFLHYRDGDLSHSQLCAELQTICGTHVTDEDRQSLQDQVTQLKSKLAQQFVTTNSTT